MPPNRWPVPPPEACDPTLRMLGQEGYHRTFRWSNVGCLWASALLHHGFVEEGRAVLACFEEVVDRFGTLHEVYSQANGIPENPVNLCVHKSEASFSMGMGPYLLARAKLKEVADDSAVSLPLLKRRDGREPHAPWRKGFFVFLFFTGILASVARPYLLPSSTDSVELLPSAEGLSDDAVAEAAKRKGPPRAIYSTKRGSPKSEQLLSALGATSLQTAADSSSAHALRRPHSRPRGASTSTSVAAHHHNKDKDKVRTHSEDKEDKVRTHGENTR